MITLLINTLRDKYYLGIVLSFGTWLQNKVVGWLFADHTQTAIAKIANLLSFGLFALGIIVSCMTIYIRIGQMRQLQRENRERKKCSPEIREE